MRFSCPKISIAALMAASLFAFQSAHAQSPVGGGDSGSNSGQSESSNSGSSNTNPDSPYPGWASQAGPIAPIPFSKVSAGVSFDPSQYQGSVLGAPLTDTVLNLSLDDAIHRALDYNLALQVRQQAEAVSSGQRTLALQALLPVVTASATTSLNETDLVAEGFKANVFAGLLPPGVTIPSVVSYQNSTGQLNLQWSAFNYSSLKRYQAARAAQDFAASNTADSRQTIILNVAEAYLQVLASFSQLQNAQALLKADKASLNDVVAEHQAGVVANIDEVRARVQFQTQEQTVIADQADLAKKNIALERMIGLDPRQQINLTEIVPYAELDAQPPLAQVREAAWNARQDYRSAQQQVHAAQIQRAAARAERYPTLTFGGYYGVVGITYGSYHGNFVAQAQLKFPLFQEARLRGDSRVAEEQVIAGQSQVENLKQQIDADLRNAYLDYDSAKSLVAVARSNLDLAQTELDQANDRFKAGVTENLPVVDAEATLAQAQTTLVNSMYQYNVSKLELARAMGIIDRQYREYLSGK
jgi:outer membrane protein TolC